MSRASIAPIRIGLLGASRIAVPAIIGPAELLRDCVVTSVAASSQSRADAYAETHGIEHAVGSYQALLERDDIDLVYNGLPPHLHAEWSMKALRAGRHVLCEKPFALNSAEAQQMVATAQQTGLHLIEAFHYRYHPMFERVLGLCHDPRFGSIRSINGKFQIPVKRRPGEFRYDPTLGGGALMDLGCYPLHWARTIAGAEPKIILVETKTDTGGVDTRFAAELEFRDGISARIACDMDESLTPGIDASLEVCSTDNRLFVENPLQPEFGSKLILEGTMGSLEEAYSGATFPHQLKYVLAQLRGDVRPITGGQDAINNMKAIDQLYTRAGIKAPTRD